MLCVKAPYLILQPLVENAIIHGIEPMERNGSLMLAVFKENKDIIVQIIDNGIGMTQEDLEHMHNESSSRSIGLSNVKKRLEYFFGRSGLLSVTSEKGIGTTVTVILPEQIN